MRELPSHQAQLAEEAPEQSGSTGQVLGHGRPRRERITGQDGLDDCLVLARGVVDVALQHWDGIEQVIQSHPRVGAGGGEQTRPGQLGDAQVE